MKSNSWIYKYTLFGLVMLLIFNQQLFSQETAEETNYYFNKVFRPSIHTVTMSIEDIPLSYPVIELGSKTKLILSFDDLESDLSDYYYTIIHCNKDWTVSDIPFYQYCTGFNDSRIEDYTFSSGTYQSYVHYKLVFPNAEISPIISGNFVIMVYDDDTEEPILIRQFYVVDQKTAIQSSINRTDIVKLNQTHQELKMNIDLQQLKVQNAFSEISVDILQNNSREIAVFDVKPQFERENMLIFQQSGRIVLPAGKEFRHVDLRTLKFKTDRVAEITTDYQKNVVQLMPDPITAYKQYVFEKDINGKFIIELKDRDNGATEADYASVNFILPSESEVDVKNVYIYGDLTDGAISKQTMMSYNKELKRYEGELFMKQGYYNYRYAAIKDGKEGFDHSIIEGDHFETENDYLVLVYYRALNERFDSLIGFKVINSNQN